MLPAHNINSSGRGYQQQGNPTVGIRPIKACTDKVRIAENKKGRASKDPAQPKGGNPKVNSGNQKP